MITAVAAAAMPVPVDVLAREQPIDGTLQIGLGAAPGLDQCDTGRRMRNKDVTQPVAAITTELADQLSDISDEILFGTQSQNIAIHC